MKHMIITAGPTHEAIDAVRYIANRSSGRTGIAIAEAARDTGWEVVLHLGPVCVPPPNGMSIRRFTSTDDLSRLLDGDFAMCDVLVMAAAVADYRPANFSGSKLSRSAQNMNLELVATPDLVQACATKRQPHQRIVGFALEESKSLDARAAQKLRDKNLDAIVANPLDTMNADRIAARVFTPDGRIHLPKQTGPIDKSVFADWLVKWIEKELVAQ
jgi:phosphopantothenoylcysteine decarboxylase / phosphopantothenate---cysteine ligase